MNVAAGAATNDPGFGEVPSALPRTGASGLAFARVAAWLVVVGGVLALIGRRRGPRALRHLH